MGTFDLKGNPFYLDTLDIQWVEETFASLTREEKIGQLFCPMLAFVDPSVRHDIIETVRPGGVMNFRMDKTDSRAMHQDLQQQSRIPLLIPSNLESGGNGATSDGTVFSNQMGIAATDDPEMAYRLGLVCGREARAVGCNWSFAPVVDLDLNPFNPITNTRTYGSDPEMVIRMAREYIRGLNASGIAETIKHWPGDGVDDRDQHLVMTQNRMSVAQWEKTYGRVYRAFIQDGAKTVMAGHIAFPAYLKKSRPDAGPENMMPATLTPELNYTLLRKDLGFNGLIVSDATSMLGIATKARREELVPRTIASGCDIFLFNKDCLEDYHHMIKGLEKGIVTQIRVDEAVMRVLALKASLKLHEQQANGTLVPDESVLEIVGCREHQDWTHQCADRAITLVRDTQNLLPLSLQKHKKVLLIGLGQFDMFADDRNKPVEADFAALLEQQGFDVFRPETENDYTALFSSTDKNLAAAYDLAIYFAVIGPYSTAGSLRITWKYPLGFDGPWFIHHIPTLFISCANPYHLYDVPDIKTLINCYTYSQTVLDALAVKILGKKAFYGKSPVDPFVTPGDADRRIQACMAPKPATPGV